MLARVLLFCGVLVVAIAAACVLSLLLAWPFMWLWNYAVVAAITVAKPIAYWTAVCLMMFMSAFVVGVRSSK